MLRAQATQRCSQTVHTSFPSVGPSKLSRARLRPAPLHVVKASVTEPEEEVPFLLRDIPAGSSYGEGFVQFSMDGPVLLDVDTLNEKLRHTGANRLRFMQKPDEAFGMVFDFDGVVADTQSILQKAWAVLAEKHSLPAPDLERTTRYKMMADRVITDVLHWTRDPSVARKLAYELAEIYSELLRTDVSESRPGTLEWLNALTNYNVPCALVSSLDKATVRRALERMHLHDHFQVVIAAEDDHETLAQRYLAAVLQLQRPPNHSVVFTASQEGITAAHNCTMRAVGVQGRLPGYKLGAADLRCGRLNELKVYNMRRLFANRGDEFMDLRKHYNNEGGVGGKKRIANATM